MQDLLNIKKKIDRKKELEEFLSNVKDKVDGLLVDLKTGLVYNRDIPAGFRLEDIKRTKIGNKAVFLAWDKNGNRHKGEYSLNTIKTKKLSFYFISPTVGLPLDYVELKD